MDYQLPMVSSAGHHVVKRFLSSASVLRPMMNASNLTFSDELPIWNSPYSTLTQILVWLVVVVLSLETIIGNAMVILAYKIERNISKQVSNRYIVSLAISDLIIGIEGFPLFTVYVLNGDRWPLGSVTCETWLFLDYTLCLVSILTVLLITADRYLSVCHTAKYLKWQSPTKTQMTIILSWLLPAIVFGIMIYGWKMMTGEAESMTGSACSAPFLANPYVNMGMYVVYYWTTLVAMLILYKGIHQAAKNLEEKAKAKERRHIALILSQRLGTQVGVSLMLHQEKERERRHAEEEERTRDSAYNTQTTVQASSGHPTEESVVNLQRIEEERSNYLSSEGYPSQKKDSADNCQIPSEEPLISVEEEGDAIREEDDSIGRDVVNNENEEKENDMDDEVIEREDEIEDTDNEHDSLLGDLESIPSRKNSKNRSSVRSVTSKCSIVGSEAPQLPGIVEERRDSLSLLFNEEDLSSVLHFKQPLIRAESVNDSEGASSIIQANRRYKKGTGSSRRNRPTRVGASRKIEFSKQLEQCQENTCVFEDVPVVQVVRENSERRSRDKDRWVQSMRRRVAKAIDMRRFSTVFRQRSCSESRTPNCSLSRTSSSSGENEEDCVRKAATVEPNAKEPKHLLAVAGQRTQLLNPQTGQRKVSTFSTVARERMISSIFSPATFFSRKRKQTKAERRAHKAFRTITFIVGCFAILWSPYYVMATIYGFCKGECIPSIIYTLSYYMCYLNSSGNPFAYALANRQFRSAFLRMMKGNFNKNG